MRGRALLFVAGFCMCSAAAETAILDATSPQFRVVDGDSVGYGRQHFRLCGIQAPERGHPLYRHTTVMLRNLLGREKITAQTVDIDKYKRKVVVLFAGGRRRSVNEAMVRQGGAYHYKKYSKNCVPFVSPQQFSTAEKYARHHRYGIWGIKR